MNSAKARELRKKLNVDLTKNQPTRINPVKKIVYFRGAGGDLTPVETTRTQIVNLNRIEYRRAKKLLKNK